MTINKFIHMLIPVPSVIYMIYLFYQLIIPPTILKYPNLKWHIVVSNT